MNFSPIEFATRAAIDALGGQTYHPATVGTDGPNAAFLPPGLALTNPPVIGFGTPNGANYGWTVQATPVQATPEPGSLVMFVLGVPSLLIFRRRRK